MPPAILVVEDDPTLSRVLEQALRESGMNVDLASDGVVGLRLASRHDLLVVDVMMPTMNGFEMVRRLRAAGYRMPVLFLTARDGLDDLVKGFALGGDDYLVKPFRLAELFARIEALLRRSRDAQDRLRFADVEIDRRTRRASRDGEPLSLSSTEFALLERLMLTPRTVVAKTALLREIWNEDGARDPNIVEAFVRNVRHKTEAGGRSRLIHTVRGHGYVLEVPDPES